LQRPIFLHAAGVGHPLQGLNIFFAGFFFTAILILLTI